MARIASRHCAPKSAGDMRNGEPLKGGMVAAGVPRRGLPNWVDRAEGWLGWAEEQAAGLALLAALAGIVGGVLVRFLDLPLPNYGEIAIVAMSPLTLLGAARCTALRRHITIDVVDYVPRAGLRRALRIVAALATVVFAAFFGWLAWGFFAYTFSTGERLIDLGSPVWIPTGFIVLGTALMGLHAALDAMRLLLGEEEVPA